MAVQSVRVEANGASWQATIQQMDHATGRAIYSVTGPGSSPRPIAVPMGTAASPEDLRAFLAEQLGSGRSGVTLLAEG